jgi:hypothetical protein
MFDLIVHVRPARGAGDFVVAVEVGDSPVVDEAANADCSVDDERDDQDRGAENGPDGRGDGV